MAIFNKEKDEKMKKDFTPPADGANTPEGGKYSEPQAPVAEGLVRMYQGKEEIDVHPTTVKSHEEAGWKVKK